MDIVFASFMTIMVLFLLFLLYRNHWTYTSLTAKASLVLAVEYRSGRLMPWIYDYVFWRFWIWDIEKLLRSIKPNQPESNQP